MTHAPDYDVKTVVSALLAVGLKAGDTVFCHSNIGFFGIPEGIPSKETAFKIFLKAFQEVLTPKGTLVVPTFTYSFARNEIFDRKHSPSKCGVFAEMLRELPKSVRSNDPMFSVAAIGARAHELTRDLPPECFGQNCFWDRFLKAQGIICNLNFDAGSTFIHYVEKYFQVPYRYDKVFSGTFRENGYECTGEVIFFCQKNLNDVSTTAAFETFDRFARQLGIVRTRKIGRGAVVAITAADTYNLIEKMLPRFPDLLIARGKALSLDSSYEEIKHV
jgi:aminoglycoside 3-N-acetyltransferase